MKMETEDEVRARVEHTRELDAEATQLANSFKGRTVADVVYICRVLGASLEAWSKEKAKEMILPGDFTD